MIGIKDVMAATARVAVAGCDTLTHPAVPALFAGDGRRERRYLEFFAVTIRNRNTRHAYLVAARGFSDWCEARGLAFEGIEPMVVAAYVETLARRYAPATVKQHLAALRRLFDWLVIGQVLAFNPAASVRGPRHVVKVGKTPVLTAGEARELLDAIDASSPVGLRDRALVGVLVYAFARVSAAVGMAVRDYYTQGKRSWVRLAEKGGKQLAVPAHHVLQDYLDEYLAAAPADPRAPLFRAALPNRSGLSDRAISRSSAKSMVQRRARAVGLPASISPHSFRGTGITEYLRNGGDLETAARIAGHESTRTTQLYNRTADDLTLDEIERVRI